MLTQSKIDKFNAIARDLYVKEYLGVDGYGKDKEYEDELTTYFSKYLQNTFYNTGYELQEFPQHSSNILKIIRVV
jgi:hypothetical protein